jgi:hypothetical protein
MGKFVLLDCRLFAGGADLSGASNKIEVSAEVEDKDATNYRSGGWKELLGAIGSASMMGEGQWEAGDPGKVDDASWAQLGGLAPWTAGPTDAIVGAVAWQMYGLRSSYEFLGEVGDVAPWKGGAKSSWPLVRGQFAHPPGTARTTSGSGSGVDLGAVAVGKRLYASLHVLSVAGTSTPTITARVESDADNTFASPTTQLTFDAATAAGGQILRTSGSVIADTWFRFAWTISGTTPSFLFAAALGIK